MAPDLNSLPPSRSPSNTFLPQGYTSTSSTTSGGTSNIASTMSNSPTSHSLAAAATMNAGMQNEESHRSASGSLPRRGPDRRRSSIRMNLNFNDPSVPGPGELQMSPGSRMHSGSFSYSPQHQRAPSLGELHQELENEQEAQVNRLLHQIRDQQLQIQALTAPASSTNQSSAIDDSTPTSERSMSFPTPQQPSVAHISSGSSAPRPRSPLRNPSLSRQSSYRQSRAGSQTGSPSLRPQSGRDSSEYLAGSGGIRDESAFYQAETQNLTRENQMLKHRIRELERQLNEASGSSAAQHSNTHTPSIHSNLASPSVNAPDRQLGDASTESADR